jgi:hypothetical protein
MLAGTEVRDLVVQHLNDIGNVMNLQWDVQTAFDNTKWAIQADEDHGKVRIYAELDWFVILDFVKVTYTFRKLLRKDSPGPDLINFKDGDKIQFGEGKEKDIEKLGGGPLPMLCNL